MEPTDEINRAIAHLYETFRVSRKIHGHAWLSDDPDLRAFERRLKQTKRNEITAQDIDYLFMNNCDSEQSVKYYLPRAFELIAQGERFINEFFVSLKIRQSNFQQWPMNEQRAVIDVLNVIKPVAPNTHLEHLLTAFDWLV